MWYWCCCWQPLQVCTLRSPYGAEKCKTFPDDYAITICWNQLKKPYIILMEYTICWCQNAAKSSFSRWPPIEKKNVCLIFTSNSKGLWHFTDLSRGSVCNTRVVGKFKKGFNPSKDDWICLAQTFAYATVQADDSGIAHPPAESWKYKASLLR